MKYTFVVSCSLDYLFALNCTMNAAKYYGTNADFYIVHDNSIPQDIQDKYEDSFPFKVKWLSLEYLFAGLHINPSQVMNKFWLIPWVAASNLLPAYDSICVLQADEFLVGNVNTYFKIAAETDIVIATEWTCCSEEFEDLFTSQTSVVLFDQLVFVGRRSRQVLVDTWKQQIAEREPDSTNHPMFCLSQSCRKNLNVDRVLGLDGHTWCWDRDEFDFRISWDSRNKKFFNERKIKVNGIHTKVWKAGLDQHALDSCEDSRRREIAFHNFSTIKDVMIEFNEMTPTVKQENYCKERFR